ncbi:MAG: ribosome maturation factor RimM [Prevotellaceae bacterium]|jgi:16S rRNA processing protein RimM|nr:ribosome maturation factor RimM [Prevotellaceae bacterium]
MIKAEEVYKIGTFNKPHGVRGELQFTFSDDIFDQVEAEYVVCLLNGIYVPFFLEEYRFRTDTTALVKLEGIDTAEQARPLTNTEVYFPYRLAEQAHASSEEQFVTWHYFVGFEARTTNGITLGAITAIDDTTVNVLFVIDHAGKELLIPAAEDFITDVDTHHKTLVLNLPEGLLDIDHAPSADE